MFSELCTRYYCRKTSRNTIYDRLSGLDGNSLVGSVALATFHVPTVCVSISVARAISTKFMRSDWLEMPF